MRKLAWSNQIGAKQNSDKKGHNEIIIFIGSVLHESNLHQGLSVRKENEKIIRLLGSF